MTHKVYVAGHKRPDTDSICSAIGYAYLKEELTGVRHEPIILGEPNRQTQCILERFGVPVPSRMSSLDTRACDIMTRDVFTIGRTQSIRAAAQILVDHQVRSLPVVDDAGQLCGIITDKDFATFYLKEISGGQKDAVNLNVDRLEKMLEGRILTCPNHDILITGKVYVGAMAVSSMLKYVTSQDVLVIGDRWDSLERVILHEVGTVVISGPRDVPQRLVDFATKKGTTLIRVECDTYAAARVLATCRPVEMIMCTDLTMLPDNALLETIKEVVLNHPYSVPIVDINQRVVGIISRTDIINRRREQVILVDHNERMQSLNNLEEVDIVEVIDHHRVGNIETMHPIPVLCRPVGCTATLVYEQYQANGVAVPANISALLLSAIISDTQMFKSPTTTDDDRLAAKRLAAICQLDVGEYGLEMFAAGLNIREHSLDQLLYQDFKESECGKVKIGIGQVELMDFADISDRRPAIPELLERERSNRDLALMAMAFTNIMTESTQLYIAADKGTMSILIAHDRRFGEGHIDLPGVVSRKKQILPLLSRPFSA